MATSTTDPVRSKTYNLVLLSSTNYRTWRRNAKAWFTANDLWSSWQRTGPLYVAPSPSANPLIAAASALATIKAYGHLWLMIDEEQQICFSHVPEDVWDLWLALETAFLTISAADRHVAIASLTAISQEDAESIVEYSQRVLAAARRVQELFPVAYTADAMLKDIQTQVLLCGAKVEYCGVSDTLAGNATIIFEDAVTRLSAVERSNSTSLLIS